MNLVADTTVLIDLWRYGRTPARLADFSAKVGEASIVIPWITEAEFSRGALFKGVEAEVLTGFYEGFALMPLDRGVMDAYCRLWGDMARRGKAPDYPDLWIAACGVAKGLPVLTRNPKHFANVPGLSIVAYSIQSA